jgi:hypothetical protein
MYGDNQENTSGVYAIDEQGELTLLHEYHDEEYSLEDLVEHFGLGRVESSDGDHQVVLVLEPKELREVKVNADAYSFDYDEGFIQMCLDIDRHAASQPDASVRLTSID